jgi:hypothetical protein
MNDLAAQLKELQDREEYVREDGIWKWRRITAFLDVMKGFDANWGDARFLDTNR